MPYVSMLMSDFVRIIAIEVCDQLKAEKKMLHTSTVPYCVATVLLWSNFHHHSNDLQLSKGVPAPGLLSDTLEQIRPGSNISQYN